MPLLHVLILAIVQGITEFLPISSSGHLVLTWELFDRAGWAVPEQDNTHRLILNVAVHVGTLLAVCLYFWRDLAQMIVGVVKLAIGQTSPGARLALYIVLSTGVSFAPWRSLDGGGFAVFHSPARRRGRRLCDFRSRILP